MWLQEAPAASLASGLGLVGHLVDGRVSGSCRDGWSVHALAATGAAAASAAEGVECFGQQQVLQ